MAVRPGDAARQMLDYANKRRRGMIESRGGAGIRAALVWWEGRLGLQVATRECVCLKHQQALDSYM